MASSRIRTFAFAIGLAVAAMSAVNAMAAAADQPSSSANMQGDQQSWIRDPHMHAFFELTQTAFANGSAAVDKPKFEHDAMVIFRDFAKSRGMNPDAMQDHLKLIPDQVIQIATEDPKVLTGYDKFVAAVFGPQ